MLKLIAAALAASAAALAVAGGAATAPSQATSLTIYSGRDAAFVQAGHRPVHRRRPESS